MIAYQDELLTSDCALSIKGKHDAKISAPILNHTATWTQQTSRNPFFFGRHDWVK